MTDLSPLRGKPLRVLVLNGPKVTDLSPLEGAPLEELAIESSVLVKDFAPVLTLSRLQKLRIPRAGKLLGPLRNHPTVKFIGYSVPYLSAPDFWAAYDTEQRAQPAAK